MYKGIKNDDNWQKIVDKHTEKLKSYNIEFDENDNLQRTDHGICSSILVMKAIDKK
jgi:hypothetical protein